MSINYTLDMESSDFAELLSFAEAAELWKVDQSTLRKAVEAGRLEPGKDCRKFGKQWVVTAKAMQREFRGGWGPWSDFKTNLRKARNAERDY